MVEYKGWKMQGRAIYVWGSRAIEKKAQLDRVSAQLAGAQGQAMQASAARQANTAGLIGGLAGIGGNLLTGLAQQGANPYTEFRFVAYW